MQVLRVVVVVAVREVIAREVVREVIMREIVREGRAKVRADDSDDRNETVDEGEGEEEKGGG